jgi:hypothetical protein
MDVVVWLRSLGLGKYEAAFRENEPVENRPLTARFGTDSFAHALCYRSWAYWLLGYPERACVDAHHAVRGAREIGQAGTLMNILALQLAFETHPHMLRHASGYALANRGHDTRALQAYLGHRSIQHTVW